MRQGVAPLVGLTTYVSIHASVKDATARISRHPNVSCFNPRICKRCDTISGAWDECIPFVSIHASVKDATIGSGLDFRLINVSIHASVKDATLSVCGVGVSPTVSIHASVKDATKCVSQLN